MRWAMLHIFICEDNVKQREQLTRYIENYVMMEQLDMEIVLATSDPNEMIDYIKNNKIVNALYFLDVDLQHEKSGIVLGAEIREYDPRGAIVFVTTHSELTYLTFLYKVEALDYIIKDDFTQLRQRIIDCIKAADERFRAENNSDIQRLQINVGDKVISEDCRKVLYFETAPTLHKITMHTKTRSVDFYGKLKDIVKLYPHFYRCHNSYIVNLENIATVNRKTREITMVNGAICHASTRYMKGMLKAYRA